MSYVQGFKDFCRTAHNTRAIGYKNGFQTRWGGEPYFDNHCVPVEALAQKELANALPAPSDTVKNMVSAISYGHDLFEDTDVTEQEVRDELKRLGASGAEVDAIVASMKAVSKPKDNYNLFTYLDGIRKMFYATVVKLADNTHNTEDLIANDKGGKNRNKIEKYQLIRHYITH